MQYMHHPCAHTETEKLTKSEGKPEIGSFSKLDFFLTCNTFYAKTFSFLIGAITVRTMIWLIPSVCNKKWQLYTIKWCKCFRWSPNKIATKCPQPIQTHPCVVCISKQEICVHKKNGIEGATKAQRQHPWQKYPWKKFREPNYVEKTINVWPSSKELKKT